MTFLKAFRLGLGIIISSVLTLTAHAQGAPTPLFANDDVIKIQVEAPFRQLVRNAERSKDPHSAILRLKDGSETHSITIAARGMTRRQQVTCKFPPLKIRFNEKPKAPALFAKQKSLKLVTHCKKASKNEQSAILEYSTYRLFNVITPQSFKVRLAEIEYIDAKNQKPILTRYGFFIEDMDDAAERNGMKELDVGDINYNQLDPDKAIRATLFQYLIRNLDWSFRRNSAGKDCCHNSKLMGRTKTSTQDLVPVPFDFDLSGVVDAPYALAPEELPVSKERMRIYRGLCKHNERAKIASQEFLQKLADPAKFEKHITSKCT